MRVWISRLLDWLRRDRLDAELADEMRFHREQLERDARAEGADIAEARAAARQRLGNVTSVHEAARERWSIPWLDVLQQDVRYSLRGLRRSPGFTAAVVITLGLGIGANAAMFDVIDRTMLRPFPHLRDPGSVHRIYLQTAGRDRINTLTTFPYTRFRDLERFSTRFDRLAAFTEHEHGVGIGAQARSRLVVGATASFFEFFDAPPALGRYFSEDEDRVPTGINVAVLDHAFWQLEYGGRDVRGESIHVGDGTYTIIGVAAPGFTGVSGSAAPAVYVPITAYATNEGGGDAQTYFHRYSWDWTQVIARRASGVSVAEATTDMSRAYVESWNASRVVHPAYRTVEAARPRAVVGSVKIAGGPDPGLEARTLVWVAGVAAIVLLVACANVVNLFLARSLRRRREVALRLALGVGRGRLAAQAFTESLVLALLGCLAGVAIAQWGGLALRRLFIPGASSVDLFTDWRTLGSAAIAALAAALVTTAAPLAFARKADLTTALKAGVREGTHQRSGMRSALLVVQAALSVVLLVGAGLFVRSLGRVRSIPLGYDVERVLYVRWEHRGAELDSAQQWQLRRRVLDGALAMPGVERGAWVGGVPFQRGTSIMNGLMVAGIDSVARLGRFTFQMASTDYFATVGTRILRGRGFTAADGPGAPTVTVVSDAMARTLWPGQEALGKCIVVIFRNAVEDARNCRTVVGIAENAVHDPVADLPLRYYLPEAQFDLSVTTMLLKLRGDPAVEGDRIRLALQAMLPGQAHVSVLPARDMVDAKLRSWRVGATMFVAFGVLALVVAAVGLYGVVSYNVGQRTHELAVRMALGAQRASVVRLVVRQGVVVAVIGVVVGSLLALGVAGFVQPLLYRQEARDPVVFGVVGVVLVVVAMLAGLWPGVRAVRVDPGAVLRSE